MSRGNRKKFKNDKEFDQQIVDVARVTRIVAGGRRFRFRVTIVIGNKKGLVGMGIGKGSDVSAAINKAIVDAKKNLVKVPVINNTIPHEIWVDFEGAKVFLKPASSGTGVIAGGAVRSVMDLAGIKNVLSKMYGSNNKPNNVQATLKGLKQLKLPEEIARIRGKKVEELVGSKGKKAIVDGEKKVFVEKKKEVKIKK